MGDCSELCQDSILLNRMKYLVNIVRKEKSCPRANLFRVLGYKV